MSLSEVILSALAGKQAKNPRYSQRSLANSIGVSPAHLSNLVLGTRPLTKAMAERISDGLELNAEQRAKLLTESLGAKRQEPHTMPEEQFRLISDWYHLAILSMTKLRPKPTSHEKIAQRLGLTGAVVHSALQRLERMNILDAARFEQIGEYFVAKAANKNFAFRKFHQVMLDKARIALHGAQNKRHFATRVLAVDRQDLDEAKQTMEDFLNEFCKKYGNKPSASEVFAISTQFYTLEVNRGEEDA